MALGDNIKRDKLIPENASSSNAELEAPQLLFSVLDGFQDPVVVADGGGKVSFANTAAHQLWGYSSEEMDSISLDELFPQIERWSSDKAEALNARLKGGKELPIHLSASIAQPNGTAWHTYFVKGINEEQARPAVSNQVIEHSSDAVLTLSKGAVVEANPAALEAFQAQGDQAKLVGKDFQELIASEEFEGLEQAEQQRYWQGEVKMHSMDGGTWLAQATISVLGSNGGQKTSVLLKNLSSERQEQDKVRRLSLVAEHTDNAVIITDAHGKIEYVNEGFTRITGYQEDEVMGRKPGDFLQGPDTDPETVKRIREHLDARRSFKEEIYNYGKNGQGYWLQLSVTPVFDEFGNLANFVAIELDVTEKKEKDLERLRLSLVAQKTDNAVILTDEKGSIEYVNDGFTRITGYTSDEVMGRKPGSFLQGEKTNPKTVRRIREHLDARRSFTEEIYNYGKDGRGYWLEINVSPLFNDDGELTNFMAIESDITDRKEQENAIKKSEKQFRQVTKAVPGAIFKLTHSENGQYHFEYVSEYAMQVFELTPREVKDDANRLLGLIDRHHTDRVMEAISTGMEKGSGSISDEFLIATNSGAKRWVRLDASISTGADGEKVAYGIFREITDRKHAENEMKAVLKAIGSSNAVMEIGLDGSIVDVNDEMKDMLGYSKEELLSMNHEDLCSPEEQQQQRHITLFPKLKKGENIFGSYKRLTGEGQEIWIEGTYNPMLDEFGTPQKFLLFCKDVTERRLRNSENRGKLRAINQSMGVVEFQTEGIITNANEAFLDLLGYQAEDIVGKHHRMLVDPKEAESNDYEAFWMKLRQGMLDEGEYKRIAKNGKEVWLKATYNPIKDDEGNLIKIVKYAYDITDQVSRQLEMVSLKNELAARMKALDYSALVSETDLYGNITFVNDKFVEVAGFTREEMMGKPHNIVRHPSTPKAVFKKMWDTIQAGKVFQERYRNQRKDGSSYWVDATITPVLDEEGKPIRYIGIRFDITEQMNQRTEMEALINAIDQSSSMAEFDTDGKILSANDNFLKHLGYSEEQVVGHSHAEFCNREYVKSPEYKMLWEALNNGEHDAATYKYINSEGERVWLEGTMNPMVNEDGEIYKIIQYTQNVTKRRLRNSENRGKLSSINEVNASVEYDLSGNIIHANDIFLNIVGYTLEELKGKHHAMLCTKEYTASQEYHEFWRKIGDGQSIQGQFPRTSKTGRPIWLDGIYTVVTDDEQNKIKIVEYVKDVTQAKISTEALTEFVQEISSGNFDAEIDLQGITPEGEIANMLESNILLQETLNNFVSEVNRVLNLAGQEGKLGERLVIEDASGSWYTLMYSINQLLESVSNPLVIFGEVIRGLADGDLTKEFEIESSGDIDKIAVALRSAINNLNALLLRIKESSNTVGDAAIQMEKRTDTMTANTNNVVQAIDQISRDMEEQVRKTEESSTLVQDVLKATRDTNDKTVYITESAEKGMQSCESGIRIIRNLVNNMTEIATSADSTSSSIEVLTRRSDEISQTLNVITEIAAQTNLLALNAAIEAARAGDAGRGFAVVAEEIRKLAEDSKRSASEIERVIKDVQKDVSEASTAIVRMRDNVTNGNEATQKAQGVFEEIANSSEKTLNISKDMRTATSSQQSVIDAIVKNIESIVHVSMKTAQSTEEVMSSTSVLDGSMEQIQETTTELSDIAEELQNRLQQFQLQH